MHRSYAEILDRRIPLSVGDAVALVLAAAHALRHHDAVHGLPAPEQILLSSGGRVAVAAVGEPSSELDQVKQLLVAAVHVPRSGRALRR